MLHTVQVQRTIPQALQRRPVGPCRRPAPAGLCKCILFISAIAACCCPGRAAETWIAAGNLQASADAPVALATAPGLLGWPCGILCCVRTSMRAIGLCQQGARPAGLLASARPAQRRLAAVAAATTLQPLGAAPRCSSGRRGLNVTAAARQESAATADFAAEINAACNAALQLMLAGEAGRAAEEQQRLRGLQQTALAAGDEQVRPRLSHCDRAWGVGCSAHRCTSAGSTVHVPTAPLPVLIQLHHNRH